MVISFFSALGWENDPIFSEYVGNGLNPPRTLLMNPYFLHFFLGRGSSLTDQLLEKLINSWWPFFTLHEGVLQMARQWMVSSRKWFRSNVFYVHPNLGKKTILTHIFQLVWNHQLDFPTKWIDSLLFCLEMDWTFRWAVTQYDPGLYRD